jgi:hypothetical protein
MASMYCWSTIRLCAARPLRRSCRSPGTVPQPCSSPRLPAGWCGVVDLIDLSHCSNSGRLSVCREAGAASIIFASASPMIKYPNVYGIDMPSVGELIAHDRTEAQVAERIGADAVVYNDLSDLEDAVRECAPELTTVPTNRIFDTSCFNGTYVTGDVNQAYFDAIEAER